VIFFRVKALPPEEGIETEAGLSVEHYIISVKALPPEEGIETTSPCLAPFAPSR